MTEHFTDPVTGKPRRVAAPRRHVVVERFRGESIPADEYVPDGHGGYRRTRILDVHRADRCTTPGCTNHIRGTEARPC